MKNFFKSNSDIISKMFVYQIGITVFGFLLYMTSAVSENRSLMLGLGIFSAIFYLSLIYIHVWELGAHDKIKIDAGRLGFDKFKGPKASLIANIPNFFFAILSTVGYLCINRTVTDAAGNFSSPEWAANLYAIAQLIGVYLNSMYIGIGDYFGIEILPYFLFVIIIPALLTSFLAYFFGTKEKYGFSVSGK